MQNRLLALLAFFSYCSVSCVLWEEKQTESEKPAAVRKKSDIIPHHDYHVKIGIDCAICHAEQVGQEKVKEGAEIILDMDTCVRCHRNYGEMMAQKLDNPKRLVDCRTCHEKIRKGERPPSHRLGWLKTHGARAESKARQHCAVCHGQDGCVSCHRTQKPKNHNNFWRHRAHGLESSMNRERCMTCHTSDYCIRCHSQTTPRNHTSMWGGSRNLHCFYCHEPDTNCSVCHHEIHK